MGTSSCSMPIPTRRLASCWLHRARLSMQSQVIPVRPSITGATQAIIEYWLKVNAPVILIVSSPGTQEGYWISIKDYFGNWTRNDPTRVTFVKSEHRFDREAFRKLNEIAAPKPGFYLAPARRKENLQTNLLTIRAYPPSLYVAGTDCRTPSDVRAQLRKTKQEVDGSWVLWEKKIVSFHDLGEEPWSSLCDAGTSEGFATIDWSTSADPVRQRIFVQLLNQTLRTQVSSKIRYWPQEECYAMAGPPRKSSYQSLKRQSKITVVSRFHTTTADGRTFEWFRHMAFRGQFRYLGGSWYLEITPTYRFTRDGYILDRFHEDRLKGIKRIEGNRAVLSSVLFWADHLRPKTSLFDGNQPPLQFGELLTFDCDLGIIDKEWLSDDPDFGQDTASQSNDLFPREIEDGPDV